MGLRDDVLRGVQMQGFDAPTSIQRRTIVPLLRGRDLLAQAACGTGKTAAYSIPILQRIDVSRRGVQAIVLVPARELAQQVCAVLDSLGSRAGVRTLACVGGTDIASGRSDVSQLRCGGVHVVVGTPARVLDLVAQGSRPLRTDALRLLVLDEADQLLTAPAFRAQVRDIFGAGLPATLQVAMFSATVTTEVLSTAADNLRSPVVILAETAELVPASIQHFSVVLERDSEKPDVLEDLWHSLADGGAGAAVHAIAFCNSTARAEALASSLRGRVERVAVLHGGLSQAERDATLAAFRAGGGLLLSTDILARGLDIQQLQLVFNIDLPQSRESYVHRAGRCGRCGRQGVAISFVLPSEERYLRDIEAAYHCTFADLPGNVQGLLTKQPQCKPAQRQSPAPDLAAECRALPIASSMTQPGGLPVTDCTEIRNSSSCTACAATIADAEQRVRDANDRAADACKNLSAMLEELRSAQQAVKDSERRAALLAQRAEAAEKLAATAEQRATIAEKRAVDSDAWAARAEELLTLAAASIESKPLLPGLQNQGHIALQLLNASPSPSTACSAVPQACATIQDASLHASSHPDVCNPVTDDAGTSAQDDSSDVDDLHRLQALSHSKCGNPFILPENDSLRLSVGLGRRCEIATVAVMNCVSDTCDRPAPVKCTGRAATGWRVPLVPAVGSARVDAGLDEHAPINDVDGSWTTVQSHGKRKDSNRSQSRTANTSTRVQGRVRPSNSARKPGPVWDRRRDMTLHLGDFLPKGAGSTAVTRSDSRSCRTPASGSASFAGSSISGMTLELE